MHHRQLVISVLSFTSLAFNSGFTDKAGKLEAVWGPMCSGKTGELIRRIELAQIRGESYKIFVHKEGNEISKNWDKAICSRNGKVLEAQKITSDELELIAAQVKNTNVIAFDEAQRFEPSTITKLAQELRNKGKKVIVCGLNLNCKGEPFGAMPQLIALADDVSKMDAVCAVCKSSANLCQLLLDGQPTIPNSEDLDKMIKDNPGKSIGFRPVCWECHKLGEPKEQSQKKPLTSTPAKSGMLEVFSGPMFAGKTGGMITHMQRLKALGLKVLCFTHEICHWTDGLPRLTSRTGLRLPAITYFSTQDMRDCYDDSYDAIMMDEGQFLDDQSVEFVEYLLRKRKRVIIGGLPLTCQDEPFGHMDTFMAMADAVYKYSAVCHRCGDDNAQVTQLLLNGQPAIPNADGKAYAIKNAHPKCDISWAAFCWKCHFETCTNTQVENGTLKVISSPPDTSQSNKVIAELNTAIQQKKECALFVAAGCCNSHWTELLEAHKLDKEPLLTVYPIALNKHSDTDSMDVQHIIKIGEKADLLCFDRFHMHNKALCKAILELQRKGKEILVVGHSLDEQGHIVESMATMLAYADFIETAQGICTHCQAPAAMCQGNKACCRSCFDSKYKKAKSTSLNEFSFMTSC